MYRFYHNWSDKKKFIKIKFPYKKNDFYDYVRFMSKSVEGLFFFNFKRTNMKIQKFVWLLVSEEEFWKRFESN